MFAVAVLATLLSLASLPSCLILLAFHISLVTRASTTHEELRDMFHMHANPFQHGGPLRNCVRSVCRGSGPSYVAGRYAIDQRALDLAGDMTGFERHGQATSGHDHETPANAEPVAVPNSMQFPLPPAAYASHPSHCPDRLPSLSTPHPASSSFSTGSTGAEASPLREGQSPSSTVHSQSLTVSGTTRPGHANVSLGYLRSDLPPNEISSEPNPCAPSPHEPESLSSDGDAPSSEPNQPTVLPQGLKLLHRSLLAGPRPRLLLTYVSARAIGVTEQRLVDARRSGGLLWLTRRELAAADQLVARAASRIQHPESDVETIHISLPGDDATPPLSHRIDASAPIDPEDDAAGLPPSASLRAGPGAGLVPPKPSGSEFRCGRLAVIYDPEAILAATAALAAKAQREFAMVTARRTARKARILSLVPRFRRTEAISSDAAVTPAGTTSTATATAAAQSVLSAQHPPAPPAAVPPTPTCSAYDPHDLTHPQDRFTPVPTLPRSQPRLPKPLSLPLTGFPPSAVAAPSLHPMHPTACPAVGLPPLNPPASGELEPSLSHLCADAPADHISLPPPSTLSAAAGIGVLSSDRGSSQGDEECPLDEIGEFSDYSASGSRRAGPSAAIGLDHVIIAACDDSVGDDLSVSISSDARHTDNFIPGPCPGTSANRPLPPASETSASATTHAERDGASAASPPTLSSLSSVGRLIPSARTPPTLPVLLSPAILRRQAEERRASSLATSSPFSSRPSTIDCDSK
jgi:hypothetical protein